MKHTEKAECLRKSEAELNELINNPDELGKLPSAEQRLARQARRVTGQLATIHEQWADLAGEGKEEPVETENVFTGESSDTGDGGDPTDPAEN